MEWDHLIGQQLGQYELLAELGRGAYSYVYQAFQPRLRRHVAIKVLRIDAENQVEFVQQFEQIAQAIAQLNHPNIASIYDFGEEQGLAYIVMQNVTGGVFKTRLGKPMAVGEAVTPIIQMAHALHHAHQRGVLHLDVRPENILIDQENPSHLLLTDFSLSQLFQAEYRARTGLPIGAPAYLAPEQIQGRKPTARTDIYALGVLLFEALAGKPVFSGDSASVILNRSLHELPPYIRGFNPAVPRELARVVSQAIARQPSERFESAEEFARALEPFRDTKERQHRLHLDLSDLSLIDDDEPEDAPEPPRGAPARQPERPQPGAHPQGPDQSSHLAESALTEPPGFFAQEPVIVEPISLIQSLGAKVLLLARRMAGRGHAGQWLDQVMPTPRAQAIAGIGSICLALLLSLSITLLAAAAPPQGSGQSAPLQLGLTQPTPTATATDTPIPTPTATPTPSGPTIDPQAAAAFANISAALSVDIGCHSNPDGASLPAGRTLYVTVCFNPRAIPGGGTVRLLILPQGATTASTQAAQRVSGGSSYYWFQFSALSPGSYTIEAFWNGRLGLVYALTLS